MFYFFPSLIPVQLLCLFSRHILWPEKGVARVGLFRLILGWTWYRISWGLYLQAHNTHVMNEATVVAWLPMAAPSSPLETPPTTPPPSVPWGCWFPSLPGNHLIWWTPPCVPCRAVSGRTDGKTEGARSASAKITIGGLFWNNRTVGTRCTRDGLNRCIIFSGMRRGGAFQNCMREFTVPVSPRPVGAFQGCFMEAECLPTTWPARVYRKYICSTSIKQ